jgi:hypothetical protein
MTNYLGRYPYALSGKFDQMDVIGDTMRCNIRASSEMREILYDSFQVDRRRLRREFMTPEPTTTSKGFYWPKEAMTGHLERASAHIPYLCRPIFNYKTPSKYGYSKYVTVRKL